MLFRSQIHLLTTGWSSTATEALYRNIPVVTYDDELATFPDDIVISGNTSKKYFDNMEFILSNNPNFEFKLAAEKWLAFYFSGVVKIESSIRSRFLYGKYDLPNKLFYIFEKIFPKFIKFIDLNYPISQSSLIKLKKLIDNRLDHLFEIPRDK